MADQLTTPLQADSPPARGSFRRMWAGLIVGLILLVAYALLHNPYWVRGGDSEVYLCLARSLATGNGYRFCSQPVALVPPGWPLVLAGAMKVSASFAWLKLLPMLAMIGGLLLMFFAVCRLTTTPRAVLVTLIAALLPPVFQLTYWFHAESLFCLLVGGSLLLALQIATGRSETWRIALLVLLCGLSVTVRWAGLLYWPIVAGVLLDGQFRPRIDRRWIAAALAAVVVVAVFVGLRLAMRVSRGPIDPRYDASLSGVYGLVNEPAEARDYLDRVLSGGDWFARLLWSSVMLAPWRAVRYVASGFGWAVAVLCLIALMDGVRRRRWMWLGAAAYFAALWINWPQPIGRYLVPLAPLLALAAFEGAAVVAGWFGSARSRPVFVSIAATLAALVLIPNAIAYAIDVWVMRSPDFHARFEGGIDQELLTAAQYLRQQGVRDGQVATSRSFATTTSQRFTSMWNRSAVFLIDRSVIPVPASHSVPPDWQALQWLQSQGVRYYLYLPAVPLFGHYRMLSENGIPIPKAETSWRLYEINDGEAARTPLEPAADGLRTVPGL